MKTYLQLVNSVLRRLREDEVSDINSSTMSKLITDFVTEAVQEVETAREWNALRTSVLIITAADTFQYSLTGVGPEYALQYLHESTQNYDLARAPTSQWMTNELLGNAQTGQPYWYDINGVDVNGDPLLNVYPIPDGVYSIYVNLKVDTTDTPDNTTTIYLPDRPIVLRAYQFAVEERGDIDSDKITLLEERYHLALSAAAASDASLNRDELVWIEE